MNNFKVYTGPTQVQTTAQRLRDAGLKVYLEGTEHVYVVALDLTEVLDVLGCGWSWRDVREGQLYF